jgi:hypothetical protein
VYVHVVAPDNDPDWVSKDYPVSKNDTDIDVQPFELSSVRAVIPSLPSSLTTSSSANSPSAIVTRHITLRLTETKGKTTWQIPDSKSQKRKGTSAATRTHAHAYACVWWNALHVCLVLCCVLMSVSCTCHASVHVHVHVHVFCSGYVGNGCCDDLLPTP